jgi:hypothetical protein
MQAAITSNISLPVLRWLCSIGELMTMAEGWVCI